MIPFFHLKDNQDTDDVTEDKLNDLCNPCVRKVVTYLAQFASDEDEANSFLALDLLCLKEGDEYCILHLADRFEKLGEAFSADQPGADAINELLDIVCKDRCFSRFISLFAALNATKDVPSDDGDSTDLLTEFGTFCTTTKDGDFCLALVFGFAKTLDAGAGDACEAGCSSACKSFVITSLKTLDCCFEFFLDILAKDQGEAGVDNIRSLVNDQCHLDTPDACVPSKMIVLFLTVTNLDYDFVQDNEDLVQSLIEIDVAISLGVPPYSVTVVGYIKLGENVQFELDIQLANDEFVQTTFDEVDNADEDYFSFGRLATLSSDSKSDPLSAYTVHDSSASLENNPGSSGESLMASLFIVAIAVFAALF